MEAGDTSDEPNTGYDEDFDFQGGLASFDKQRIFNEIRVSSHSRSAVLLPESKTSIMIYIRSEWG